MKNQKSNEELLWDEITYSFIQFQFKMKLLNRLRETKELKVKTRQTFLDEYF